MVRRCYANFLLPKGGSRGDIQGVRTPPPLFNHLHAFSGKLPAVVHERRTLAGLTLMHLHRDVAVETEEVIRQFSETNTRRMFSGSVLLD